MQTFGPYEITSDQHHLKTDLIQLDQFNHICGINGSGKSTLMNAMIDECQQKKIKYSWVDQNYRSLWFWWLSPRTNLERAWKSHSADTELWQDPLVVNEMHWLEPFLDRKPSVDISAKDVFQDLKLSGGQLQKIILLREVLSNPDILFLDEAFSALDEKNMQNLISWLVDIAQKINVTVISIAHFEGIYKVMPGKILQLEPIADQSFILKNTAS